MSYIRFMHRLFVAIRPPADIRSRLLSLMGGIAGARWQTDDQLHITLRFIGEVDARCADDIMHCLAAVHFTPFSIALDGLGIFDRRGRVETLWAGVHPRDDLSRLHRKVDRACVMAGLPPEARSYLPHVTLARFRRDAGSTGMFLTQNAGFSSPCFTVGQFGLFESHLGHTGSVYHLAAAYDASGESG